MQILDLDLENTQNLSFQFSLLLDLNLENLAQRIQIQNLDLRSRFRSLYYLDLIDSAYNYLARLWTYHLDLDSNRFQNLLREGNLRDQDLRNLAQILEFPNKPNQSRYLDLDSILSRGLSIYDKVGARIRLQRWSRSRSSHQCLAFYPDLDGKYNRIRER